MTVPLQSAAPSHTISLTEDQKYNFVSCLVDSAGWTFGMAFFSTSTIVPAFLSKLGAGNIVIGALPALITVGYTVPGIFVASRISRLKLAKRWLYPVAVLERVPLVSMGFAALFIQSHTLLLWTFLALFSIHAVLLGCNQPAYWTVIAKAIPERFRGRLFGLAGLAGGVCGVAVVPIAHRFLGSGEAHLIHGCALCFIVGSVVQFLSIQPLAFLREPQSEVEEKPTYDRVGLSYFEGIWGSRAGFRTFIWMQALLAVWLISSPFYLLDGIRRLHVGPSEIGLYTATGVIVGAFGGWVCGSLSDRYGNRLILLMASFAACCASLYAVVAPTPVLLTLVFGLSAFAGAGSGLASYNITLEFAPTDQDIPHYMAFFNLVMAPLRGLALVAGGVISQSFGYTPLFWISSIAAIASFVLTLGLVEPRNEHKVTGSLDPAI